jgi:hypothetical protein
MESPRLPRLKYKVVSDLLVVYMPFRARVLHRLPCILVLCYPELYCLCSNQEC